MKEMESQNRNETRRPLCVFYSCSWHSAPPTTRWRKRRLGQPSPTLHPASRLLCQPDRTDVPPLSQVLRTVREVWNCEQTSPDRPEMGRPRADRRLSVPETIMRRYEVSRQQCREMGPSRASEPPPASTKFNPRYTLQSVGADDNKRCQLPSNDCQHQRKVILVKPAANASVISSETGETSSPTHSRVEASTVVSDERRVFELSDSSQSTCVPWSQSSSSTDLMHAPHGVAVARFSALPRSISMLVNVSSASDADSDCDELRTVPRPTAFFVPVGVAPGQPKPLALSMPDKLRARISKRQRQMELKRREERCSLPLIKTATDRKSSAGKSAASNTVLPPAMPRVERKSTPRDGTKTIVRHSCIGTTSTHTELKRVIKNRASSVAVKDNKQKEEIKVMHPKQESEIQHIKCSTPVEKKAISPQETKLPRAKTNPVISRHPSDYDGPLKKGLREGRNTPHSKIESAIPASEARSSSDETKSSTDSGNKREDFRDYIPRADISKQSYYSKPMLKSAIPIKKLNRPVDTEPLLPAKPQPRFEIIPEERSGSLDSSNGDTPRNISNKQRKSSFSSKLTLINKDHVDCHESYKGKEALSNEHDLLSVSKGWINFYLLKDSRTDELARDEASSCSSETTAPRRQRRPRVQPSAGWTVTVAASLREAQEVEMRLTFPASPASQSDSGLGDEPASRPLQRLKLTLTAQGNTERKQEVSKTEKRPFHGLPEVNYPPNQIKNSKKSIKSAYVDLSVSKHAPQQLHGVWADTDYVSPKEIMIPSGRLQLLSVKGCAINPEKKPYVQTMSERDVTRGFTPRQ